MTTNLTRNEIKIMAGLDETAQVRRLALKQIQSKRTSILVGTLLAAGVGSALIPGVGPIVAVACGVIKWLDTNKIVAEKYNLINEGRGWDLLPEADRKEYFDDVDPAPAPAPAPALRSAAVSQDSGETLEPTVVSAGWGEDTNPVVASRAISSPRSFFLLLAENPHDCFIILASQRTGKTSNAAAATRAIAQESGTKIFYLNLFDHNQGNDREFAHAICVIGNVLKLGSAAGNDLVRRAVALVNEFITSPNAILVVDEWVSTGSIQHKGRRSFDDLWAVLAPLGESLASNGKGSGQAVWAIAPRFTAKGVRDEAKFAKEFIPVILSIAPDQAFPWTNPENHVTSHLRYTPSLVGQAHKNWPEHGIKAPTQEEIESWKFHGQSHIWWTAEHGWQALDRAPAQANLPVPPQFGLDDSLTSERSEFSQEVAASAIEAQAIEIPVEPEVPEIPADLAELISRAKATLKANPGTWLSIAVLGQAQSKPSPYRRNRKALNQALKDAGYLVETRKNGRNLVDYFKSPE